VAPLAVRSVELPLQMVVGLPLMDTVGFGTTVTVTVAVFEHEPDLPVTVYVVVPGGVAIGFALVVLVNPVAGDQEYVKAPVAVNWLLPPAQMEGLVALAVTLSDKITLTVAVAVAEQPFVVPVTV
jgi:hypothetical protein